MRAILAIARAEVLKSWTIIAVPLLPVIGVLIMGAAGIRSTDRTYAGNVMAFLGVFELPLALVPAVILGLNLFGPDLKQRRLSFFLTRPCASWQLWVGRLLGAAVIVSVGCIASAMLQGVNVLMFAGLLACLLLAMNALAMILAANSPRWFIADLLAWFAFLAALGWSLAQALRQGDPAFSPDRVQALMLSAMVALFFAGLAFVTFGHSDGPSGHRAHSLTMWSFAVSTLLAFGAYRAHEWSRPLSSMRLSGWAIAAGPTQVLLATYQERFGAAFLLDTRSGDARRVSTFAQNGATRDLEGGRWGSLQPRIDPSLPGFVGDELVISSPESNFATVLQREVPRSFPSLNLMGIGKGGGLAIFGNINGIEVIDTGTGSTTFRYALRSPRWAVLQEDGKLAIVSEESGVAARLTTLAPDGKVLQERRFPISEKYWYAKIHLDSGRVAITEHQQGVTLYESDGAVLAHLVPEPPTSAVSKSLILPHAVLFTRTGDLLVASVRGLSVVRHGESAVIELPLKSEGRDLGPTAFRRISGELQSGEIVIVDRAPSPDGFPYERLATSLVVDPLSGAVSVRLPGLRPLGNTRLEGAISTRSPSEDSALRLFAGEAGDIMFLDPGSTTPRLLVKSTIAAR